MQETPSRKKTSIRSPFLHSAAAWQTDRQTDTPRYGIIGYSRPRYAGCASLRHKKWNVTLLREVVNNGYCCSGRPAVHAAEALRGPVQHLLCLSAVKDQPSYSHDSHQLCYCLALHSTAYAAHLHRTQSRYFSHYITQLSFLAFKTPV